MKPNTQKQPIYIVGNWKSNPAKMKDLEKLQKGYNTLQPGKNTRVVACPSPLHQLLELKKPVFAGAQDVSLRSGTGFWSTEMLKDCGVSYCIIGHSERRAHGEADSDIRNKMVILIESGLVPIVCIGESIRDENGKYINIIKHQLRLLFEGLTTQQVSRVIIAYEPIWAIGAGALRACEPAECYEAIHIIREEVAKLVPGISSQSVVVLYGGSVDSNNALSYIDLGAANGLLIGRTSLDISQMKSILKSVAAL